MTAYWFRPKRFGYGATPCTWQGWAFTIAMAAALFACAELARRTATHDLLGPGALPFWFAVLAGATILAGGVYVSSKKTEGGLRWRGWR